MSRDRHICFDKILPHDLLKPQHTIRAGGRSRAIIIPGKLWLTGSTLNVRFLDGSGDQQALVREQAAWWTEHANLDFEFNNAADAEIRITFDSDDGAWSYIGTDATQIPSDQATMNLGFLDGGTAAHEFGHAIGLVHEHQNPAGGIEWNRDEVIADLSGPPNNWSLEQIENNVFRKYSADQIRGTEFDGNSIMLYFFPDEWVSNGPGTRRNETLSEMDKAFVASAEAYPGRTELVATDLSVIDLSSTAASIGQPGEEDVFRFNAEDDGRYTVETDGQTDVVMKLFGPNSQTRVIAEDDDGGDGFNSRIVADLSPGQYLVQIRHFNRSRGTGTYGIRVSR